MSMEKIFGSLLWKGWRILEQLAPAEVTEHSYLIELEGCLSLVAMDDEDVTVDIWILRNFGESNWEKRSSGIVPFSNYECLSSVASWNSEKIFITSEHYFILHKTWGELDLAENFGWNTSVVFTYTESFSNAVVTWIQSIGQVWSMKEKMIFSSK
ncbi:uncharacterized protein LOC119989153 isoform X1 [Tripterygium wilfordii]|uniref:uncharacterized protein LOC119989153 isoform X1 n=1 Tax=Tripterygium wilfordii TaxID=458696 RepID=UPI0018F8414F|nr:uncharacterized protein LOC119989153 isoform X1 [Tripterygium wilfordii]